MKLRLLCYLILISLLPLGIAKAEEPRIKIFSPQGTMKSVRQVRAMFSEPVVAFGDPRLTDPFKINCPD